MRRRFRLDPKEASREPAPAAPVAAPPADSPPPRAPDNPPMSATLPHPAGVPAPSNKRKRAVVGVAIFVALLLIGGAVALFVATSQAYPDKYVLKKSEHPEGMSEPRLSNSELRSLGMSRNPGPVDMDENRYGSQFDQFGMDRPEQAHGQAIQTGEGRIFILLLKYETGSDAVDNARTARLLCSGSQPTGAVLRDGAVLVGIMPDLGVSPAKLRAVAQALMDKTSDLAPVCGLT